MMQVTTASARAHGVRQLLIAVVLIMWSGTVLPAPITSDDVRVIDGDTIRLHQQRPDVRLVGFNAPETRRAICDAERVLGDRATARVRELVRSSRLDFEFVACACSPGTEGTQRCNYGRRCGILKADGRDVAAILISENLAVPFVCGQTRCPPTPKPWCK
jgi:endonuclease YncB( thermonuclease family)